jgi:hypothetical protein
MGKNICYFHLNTFRIGNMKFDIQPRQTNPLSISFIVEEFEDTKSVIRIRKLKMYRQHNDQKKKDLYS